MGGEITVSPLTLFLPHIFLFLPTYGFFLSLVFILNESVELVWACGCPLAFPWCCFIVRVNVLQGIQISFEGGDVTVFIGREPPEGFEVMEYSPREWGTGKIFKMVSF